MVPISDVRQDAAVLWRQDADWRIDFPEALIGTGRSQKATTDVQIRPIHRPLPQAEGLSASRHPSGS
jgi:hypothetical protein